jgi:hypothetical protein
VICEYRCIDINQTAIKNDNKNFHLHQQYFEMKPPDTCFIEQLINSTLSAQTKCNEKYQSIPNAFSEATPSLSEIFKKKL